MKHRCPQDVRTILVPNSMKLVQQALPLKTQNDIKKAAVS